MTESLTLEPGQASGLLLGLALGDALGARFEGGPLERALWRVIGRTRSGERRWTDDTQMSLDVAESHLALGEVDGDDLAHRFAASYRWSRGYGPGAAKLLKSIRRGADWRQANRSVFADGSFGNGGAMRAPVLALFYGASQGALSQAAEDQARVTHAHPLALEGARLIALSTRMALERVPALSCLDRLPEGSAEFQSRLALARTWVNNGVQPSAKEVRRGLGCGISSLDSCVTAIYLGLRFRELPFVELAAFVARMGGDVDTVNAMAGAMWGAARGADALPTEELTRLEGLPRLEALGKRLEADRIREST